MRPSLLFLPSTTLLLMVSCQLTKPYEPPPTTAPIEWKNTSDQNAPNESQESSSEEAACQNENSEEEARAKAIEQLANWWEIFDDPVLNQLEEQAVELNYHLLATFEKVLEARAIARINLAPLYPSAYFSPVYQRSQMLVTSPISIPSSLLTATTPNAPPPSSSSSNQLLNTGLPTNVFRFLDTEYALPFNFQYEVDLWKRLHNIYYGSVYRAQAAEEDYFNVLLSLTAEVASSYFQMRDYDFQGKILDEAIRSRQTSYEINRDRFKAGLLNYVDVSRAEVQVANAQSDSINVKRLRETQVNLIATLVGVPASTFSLDYHPVEVPPPKIPTGLPSELLCRRPDILEAERLLAAAYTDIGVAYSGFFPSLNLNASVGLESPVTSILFDWKARMWEIGASIVQLIFDAGRTQATVDLAIARFREQFNNYQETVLSAFQEVETALVNLREKASQAQALENSVKSSQITYDLSYMRYRQGVDIYLNVTDAERDLLQAKQNSAIVLGDRYVQTVALIQALGGGWGTCECE
ncbi:MAG: efflux transporter outer membrane subunit [Chlamydiales bacterium]